MADDVGIAAGVDGADRSPVRLTVGVVSALTTAVMPIFFLGAVGVFVRRDLDLSSFQFGAVLSAFNAGWLPTSMWGGRLADRLGGRRTVAVGVVGSGVVLLGVAAGSGWWALLVLLAAAGFANALVQPGASAALAHGVDVRRHGLALGMKGVNAPVAALLGGIAVPLVAVPFGWRWVFVIGAATVALYFGFTPDPWRTDRAEGTRRHAPRNRTLLALVVAAAAGNAAASFLTGFFVEWQTLTGMAEGPAGLLLAVGSGVGALARVAWGHVSDRRGGDGTRGAVVLFCAGAAALGAISLGLDGPLDVLVTVVAFGAGWGWLGLLFLAVVRAAPDAPGDATGLLGIGLALGGLVGPGALGALADVVGLQVAWWGGAVLLAAAAVACAAATPPRSSPAVSGTRTDA
jgi:MFS family permease